MFEGDQGTLARTDPRLNGKKLKIGLVQARFNLPVTQALTQACTAELIELGVQEKNIQLVQVPGALEVALALAGLAESAGLDALIALGCVIRGETYHFELVANESAAGISRVALDYQLPIANAILTTETLAQAQARQVDKGRDAARVAVEMANLMVELQ